VVCGNRLRGDCGRTGAPLPCLSNDKKLSTEADEGKFEPENREDRYEGVATTMKYITRRSTEAGTMATVRHW